MKKILMIGAINGVFIEIYEALQDIYQVQVSEQIDKANGKMIKLLKPEAIILINSANGAIQPVVYSELRREWMEIPVLVIGEKGDNLSDSCPLPQFRIMVRPVNMPVLKEQLEDMMNPKPPMVGQSEDAGNTEKGDLEDITQESAKKEEESGEESGRKRIFAVDDSPMILRSVKSILEPDYEVFVATSGEKALIMMAKVNPDLIILDYEMPGKSGLETLQSIRKNQDTKDIPVIFLTGVTDRNRIIEVMSQKPAAYMLKPIDAAVLKTTVAKCF